ncbi:radical SAM protein [Candidatus Kuenenbacteria bacterium]|nr:radical SAM protein [Candidatus Kuenenbacteria bacterium]
MKKIIKDSIKKILGWRIINLLATLVLPEQKKRLNKIMALEEARRDTIKPNSRPSKITISLSNCCNLLCPICSIHNLRSNGIRRAVNNISIENIKVMDEIFDKAKSANFMGHIGESILNPDFIEIINYIKLKYKLELSISTNGMGLNEKIQDTMLKIGFDSIAFSIHASTPETYGILQAGNFEMVIGNLTSLAEKKIKGNYKKPKISIVYALNKVNVDEAYKMIDLAKKLRVNALNFCRYLDYNHKISKVIFDDIEEANNKIDSLYEYAREHDSLEALPKERPYLKIIEEKSNRELCNYNEEIKCTLPWTGLQMRASYSHDDSYYLGCCNVFNSFLFNYKKHIDKYGRVDFEKIWHHPVLQYLRQTVNADGGRRNPLCAYCKSSQRAHLKATNNKENYRIKLEMIDKFFQEFSKQYQEVEPVDGLEILYTEDEELHAMS